jgi:hypothetical protein
MFVTVIWIEARMPYLSPKKQKELQERRSKILVDLSRAETAQSDKKQTADQTEIVLSPVVETTVLQQLLNRMEQRTREIVSLTKQGASIPLMEAELLLRCDEADGALSWGAFHRLATKGEEFNDQIKDYARSQSEQKRQDILNTAQAILQFVAAIRFKIAEASNKGSTSLVEQSADDRLIPQEKVANIFENEIRADTVSQLGRLVGEGEDLRNRLMLDHLAYDAQYRFDLWEKKCEELITTSLDEKTLRFFRTPVSSIYNPLRDRLGTGISYNQSGLFEKIASRVQRLRTIREKIESGELNIS